MQSNDYTVDIEGFIFGQYRHKGETIPLNVRQARDFLRERRISKKGAKPAARKGTSLSEKPKADEQD